MGSSIKSRAETLFDLSALPGSVLDGIQDDIVQLHENDLHDQKRLQIAPHRNADPTEWGGVSGQFNLESLDTAVELDIPLELGANVIIDEILVWIKPSTAAAMQVDFSDVDLTTWVLLSFELTRTNTTVNSDATATNQVVSIKPLDANNDPLRLLDDHVYNIKISAPIAGDQVHGVEVLYRNEPA